MYYRGLKMADLKTVLELAFIGATIASFGLGFSIGFIVRHLMREK